MNKQQKTICILLTIFTLLLGMCFDCVQTDSFFSCYSTELSSEHSRHPSPAIETGNNVSILNQICSGQILGRPSPASIQEQMTRRSYGARTGKGHSSFYILMSILPLMLLSILISAAYEFQPDIRNSSIIMRYIHHKDGKKPKLSF